MTLPPKKTTEKPAESGTPDSAGDQSATPKAEVEAEAARYALLCRLYPSLYHNFAGALQPIGMIAMTMEKRLQHPTPDIVAIAKNASAIATSSKQAGAVSKGVMGWLAPIDNVPVSIHDGVEELLELLATDLCLYGFDTTHDIPATDEKYPRILFRTAVAGALIALCDGAALAGTVRVAVSSNDAGATATLTLSLDGKISPADIERRYRKLTHDDARALAVAVGIRFSSGDNWISLQLPRSRITAA